MFRTFPDFFELLHEKSQEKNALHPLLFIKNANIQNAIPFFTVTLHKQNIGTFGNLLDFQDIIEYFHLLTTYWIWNFEKIFGTRIYTFSVYILMLSTI